MFRSLVILSFVLSFAVPTYAAVIEDSTAGQRAEKMYERTADAYTEKWDALIDAACSGNEATVKDVLAKSADDMTEIRAKYGEGAVKGMGKERDKICKKAHKCANKNEHQNIVALIERDLAGEHIMSVQEEIQARQKAAEAAVAATDEKAGMEAESAGNLQEALELYRKALRGLGADPAMDADARIRERLIKVALRLSPPPAIPEEAERFQIRAAAMARRTETDNFKLAIAELKKAVDAAPWWGTAYYNLALYQEKSGDPAGAISSFKYYLLAEPDSEDAPAVKRRIIELEVDAEQIGGKAGPAAQKNTKAILLKDGTRIEGSVESELNGMTVIKTSYGNLNINSDTISKSGQSETGNKKQTESERVPQEQ